MRKRCVLLDRDGTIIVERNYLSDPAQVELLPGAASGLRHLAELGLRLVVVTNQSGIGRRYFDWSRLQAIHDRLRELLAVERVTLDGIYVCPHTPDDQCNCRKPRPGLVIQAEEALGFEAAEGFVIGDKPCDIDLGRCVGARSLLVRTGYGREYERLGTPHADSVVDDLTDAARVIARLLPLL